MSELERVLGDALKLAELVVEVPQLTEKLTLESLAEERNRLRLRQGDTKLSLRTRLAAYESQGLNRASREFGLKLAQAIDPDHVGAFMRVGPTIVPTIDQGVDVALLIAFNQ